MINLFKFINLPVFAISLCIGIFAVYVMSTTQQRKIYVFPNPENDSLIQYKDSSDACFQVKQTPVKCPAASDPIGAQKVVKIPVQSG
jgi:hypothetical protein